MDLETKAHRAKAILEDELVVAAFTALDNGCKDTFFNGPGDAESLREAWDLLQMSRKFRSVFESHIKNFEMAKLRAEQERRDQFRA